MHAVWVMCAVPIDVKKSLNLSDSSVPETSFPFMVISDVTESCERERFSNEFKFLQIICGLPTASLLKIFSK